MATRLAFDKNKQTNKPEPKTETKTKQKTLRIKLHTELIFFFWFIRPDNANLWIEKLLKEVEEEEEEEEALYSYDRSKSDNNLSRETLMQ